MAITFDAESAYTTSSSTDTLTWSHTRGTNATLIVTIGISQNRTVSGVTFNGTALTLAKGKTNSGTAAYIYYLNKGNGDFGTYNVEVKYNSAQTNLAARAISFKGMASSALGATNDGSGTAQQKNIALTTTALNSVIIDNHGAIDGTHAPISGQTRIANTIGASNRASGYEIVSSITGYTQSWSSTTSSVYSVVAAEFLESVASGPTNLKTYNTNLKANIKTINTNAIANVKSLNTNT